MLAPFKSQTAQPLESSWVGTIATGTDGLRKRRDIDGEMLRFPTGEAISQDNTGGLIVRDQQGRIVKTISGHGSETKFSYNDQRELIGIRLQSGLQFERHENGHWTIQQVNGSKEASPVEYRLLDDGTLRAAYTTGSGNRYFREYRLDGSQLIVDERGRITAVKAELEVQQTRFYTIIEKLLKTKVLKGEEHQRLCDTFHSLKRRIQLQEVSEVEAAKTVFHICRLLESGQRSPLGIKQCVTLAHELLYYASCPDFASGDDALSGFTALLFRNQPSQAAMLVAEMSTYQRYMTAGGLQIPYAEELMDPSGRKKREWSVAHAPERSFESNRLLRVVLINIVERLRMAEHASKANVALLAPRKRLFSTREFGRVFTKDLGRLWQEITAQDAKGMDFAAYTRLEEAKLCTV